MVNKPDILNYKEILSIGKIHLRSHALDIISRAIHAADPYKATKKDSRREGDLFQIGTVVYDLRKFDHIFVIGAGKATQGIALALEELLGDRITDGVVVLKHGEQDHLQIIRVVYASHPVPDEGSLLGGQELLRLAKKAGPKDIVFSAITGGSSALAILPPEGISLADKQALNSLLLASGATIFEINAVRKHISQIKGGRLAQAVFPAELVCLTVSDVVGDRLDYITDLTVPDTSTYLDAWHTLEKYGLWEKLPASVKNHLQKGAVTESPKELHGTYHPFVLVPGNAAFQAAIRRCQELGYETEFLDREIEGESQDEARALVEIAKRRFGQACRENPCALVASGETIVTLSDPHGKGGPNQEFALSAAIEIAGLPGMVVTAIDMDGTDGPTDVAGAIVDGRTVQRARNAGLEPAQYLASHSSLELLETTKDLIYTGPTGTNVNDIMLVLMEKTG